jgi:hypothetical protein
MATDRAEHEASQQKVMFGPTAYAKVVHVVDIDNPSMFLERNHRLMPSHAPLIFPHHDSRIEWISNKARYDAVGKLLVVS